MSDCDGTNRSINSFSIGMIWDSTRENLSSGFSDKAIFKSVFSVTETSKKIEVSPVASLDIILSNMRITKALIRLRGCAGWSAPVLFAKPRRQVLSRRGPC